MRPTTTYRSPNPNARRQTPNTKHYTEDFYILGTTPLPTKLTRHPLIIPPANIPPPPSAPPIPPIRRTLHKQRQHGQHEHNHGGERRHDDDARPVRALGRAIRTGRVRAHNPAVGEIEAVQVEKDDGDVVGIGRGGQDGGVEVAVLERGARGREGGVGRAGGRGHGVGDEVRRQAPDVGGVGRAAGCAVVRGAVGGAPAAGGAAAVEGRAEGCGVVGGLEGGPGPERAVGEGEVGGRVGGGGGVGEGRVEEGRDAAGG